jgi:uncharacterized protein YaiI (UPF0178 family)
LLLRGNVACICLAHEPGVVSAYTKSERMRILVDADAMPGDVKRLMFRAAERETVPLVLVANVALRHPESELFSSVVVEGGFNAADDWLAEQSGPGDLVVTADIPLAGRVVAKGAMAVDPRGSVFSEENVGARLATRNLMDELRGANLIGGGGPRPYSKKDLQRFATAFNTLLQRLKRK